MHHRLLAGFFLIWTLLMPANAATLEEVIDLPVTVHSRFGLEARQNIKVAMLRDASATGQQPFLVLGHGRPANGNFIGYKWQSYRKQAQHFVSRGFVVFIPLRVGYGETGGIDVEESGHCTSRDYEFSYAVGGIQTRAVVDFARTLPFVAPERGVVAGQSFGGTLAIEAAAKNLPGVVATINFAGGGGGNPEKSPENPCSPHRLEGLFADYGKTARVPTLWLYSENDRYWGKDLPHAWFAAFTGAGGKGEFVQLAALTNADGHLAFSRSMAEWIPHVDTFLRSNGFTERTTGH